MSTTDTEKGGVEGLTIKGPVEDLLHFPHAIASLDRSIIAKSFVPQDSSTKPVVMCECRGQIRDVFGCENRLATHHVVNPDDEKDPLVLKSRECVAQARELLAQIKKDSADLNGN